MGIPHKAVNCKRIIFLFVFIFANVLNAVPAKAYDSLFIVEGVQVDVTAESSVAAQEQAFEQAQVKAFEVLAARMVSDAQAGEVQTPDSLTISSFVKDYEVTNESLSDVRYVGVYTFRFDEGAVSKYFSVSGVSFTESSSKPLLVLPIFQIDGKNSIWSENNIWMQAWVRARFSRGVVPIEVPIGDLMDISDIDDNNALSYDRARLDRMLARYNAKEAAIMIGVPDLTLAGIDEDDQTAAGYLRISVYRTDRITAEHVQDINMESSGSETRAQLYDRAVQGAYTALQKDWKNKTIASAAESQKFHIRALFNSLKQWTQIQKTLESTLEIRDVAVQTLTRTSAYVTFTFRGDADRLRDTLSRSALNLQPQQPPQSPDSGAPVFYDLTFGQKKTEVEAGFYRGAEPASGDTTGISGSESPPPQPYGQHTF